MVVCVECGAPVKHLYKEFSKGSIRLTRCEQCGEFADKYVEYDNLMIFIDLILHREGVYRHLLFNRLPFRESGMRKEIAAVAFCIISLDAYTKWFLLRNHLGGDTVKSEWSSTPVCYKTDDYDHCLLSGSTPGDVESSIGHGGTGEGGMKGGVGGDGDDSHGVDPTATVRRLFSGAYHFFAFANRSIPPNDRHVLLFASSALEFLFYLFCLCALTASIRWLWRRTQLSTSATAGRAGEEGGQKSPPPPAAAAPPPPLVLPLREGDNSSPSSASFPRLTPHFDTTENQEGGGRGNLDGDPGEGTEGKGHSSGGGTSSAGGGLRLPVGTGNEGRGGVSLNQARGVFSLSGGTRAPSSLLDILIQAEGLGGGDDPYLCLVAGLVISMYGKLGTLLMMIWDVRMGLRPTIQLFVAIANMMAIKAFLQPDVEGLAEKLRLCGSRSRARGEEVGEEKGGSCMGSKTVPSVLVPVAIVGISLLLRFALQTLLHFMWGRTLVVVPVW
uniref:Protein ARV n=1 Tax=Chromera velia CCMP2878 TaxID=1169474 RepID=A0A0G4GJX6_9ALVE|eukprot:Cvel_22233.t1-p1 / transcript=Cvel_22233.t1 / gene=Cvel_22233 / organism=Chromera_velia_CCMP2878 / gene_product=Protein arv1 homolog, putative / transcript_product=Protein arv1 homolog, putative / location=Cvel_scaffold2164:146-1639(-) / protein_length=498 / sequence_SO=supercontig / SO=protein_coding / is_pseudo=false